MNKTDYYSMKVKELLALCKGEPTYAGYSRFTKKSELIDFMLACEEAEYNASMNHNLTDEEIELIDQTYQAEKAQPAITKPEPLKPEEYIDSIAMGPAPLKYSRLKTVVSWGNWQFGVDAGFENLSIIQVSTCRHWIALWDWACLSDAVDEITYGLERCGEIGELQLDVKKPPQLIPVFTAGDDDDDEEGEPAHLPSPTPEFPPTAQSTIKDWLDNRGFRAQFQSLISCRSITIEKLWTLAETFTKQGGVRYLQVLNLDSQESWFIHWDTQWESFKDACRLFENVLARCTKLDELNPPKPAITILSKYKMGEGLSRVMGCDFKAWMASEENSDHRGSDPRRERTELPNIDEVCINCNDTHLCPGRNNDCGCKSETDCPTLGWCASCNDLPYHNLEPAVWEEVPA